MSFLCTILVISYTSLVEADVQNDEKITLHFHFPPGSEEVNTSNNTGSEHVLEDYSIIGEPHPIICECGNENIEDPGNNFNRISGGRETLPNQYPWMAKIDTRFPDDDGGLLVSNCGGTLISDRHVLTAYHCIDRIREEFDNQFKIGPTVSTVKLGAHHRNEEDKAHYIATSYAPPGLIPSKKNRKRQNSFDHDIAILLLEEPVKFDSTIMPVCLPQYGGYGRHFVGKTGRAMGWGYVDKAEMSPYLKHVDLRINGKTIGGGRNPKYFFGTDVEIIDDVYQDPCSGDSGGPLVVKDPDTSKWVILGTVSGSGYNCKTENSNGLGVWNKVTAHLKWINKVLYDDHANMCA